MVVVNWLVNYKMVGVISTTQIPKFKGTKTSKAWEKSFKKLDLKKLKKKSYIAPKPVEKTTKLVQQMTKIVDCFICNGPHRANDYLKIEKLSTFVIVVRNGDSNSDGLSSVIPF